MPTPILMPALSPTMEAGTLSKWLVKEGDSISSGDVIAEIETDKATMEVEAVDEGTVGRIMVAEGTADVPVNQTIAMLLQEGESEAALEDGADGGAAGKAAAGGPELSSSGQSGQHSGSDGGSGAPAPSTEPASSTGGNGSGGGGGRIFASPLARRLAANEGIDLAALTGSGPHGRIVKRDIEDAVKAGTGGPAAAQPATQATQAATQAAQPAPAAAPAAQPATPASTPSASAASQASAQPAAAAPAGMSDDQIRAMFEPGSFREIPHDGMRKTIARRLTESKQTVPHFYLTVDIELDALLKLRGELNAAAGADSDGKPAYKLSVNDFIIKALALSLRTVPMANATYTTTARLVHEAVDVGVAVAIPDGLVTPVVRTADTKTLSGISNEMKDLARRARDKKLQPAEYQGGTTAVSNLGMFGIKDFSAVINPPQGSILAVGEGSKRAVVKDGALAIATVMTVTLSVDHRVVDGALGAEVLQAFKGFMENPMRLLV